MKNNKSKKCTNCKKKYQNYNQFYPFCSKKCSEIDLSKWLNEEYFFADDVIEQE